MISQSAMTYQANRAFALAEPLDTTCKKAYQAANEGAEDYESVIEGVKGLLFCAREIADNLAHDLDALSFKVEPATQKPAPINDDLHSLGLASWAGMAVRKNGINTVSQLTRLSEIDLMRMADVGQKTIKEVKAGLAANGLSLSAGGAA